MQEINIIVCQIRLLSFKQYSKELLLYHFVSYQQHTKCFRTISDLKTSCSLFLSLGTDCKSNKVQKPAQNFKVIPSTELPLFTQEPLRTKSISSAINWVNNQERVYQYMKSFEAINQAHEIFYRQFYDYLIGYSPHKNLMLQYRMYFEAKRKFQLLHFLH